MLPGCRGSGVCMLKGWGHLLAAAKSCMQAWAASASFPPLGHSQELIDQYLHQLRPACHQTVLLRQQLRRSLMLQAWSHCGRLEGLAATRYMHLRTWHPGSRLSTRAAISTGALLTQPWQRLLRWTGLPRPPWPPCSRSPTSAAAAFEGAPPSQNARAAWKSLLPALSKHLF